MAGVLHSPALRISPTFAPRSSRSCVCPRLKSCNQKSAAFGVPSAANFSFKHVLAALAVKCPKGLCPTGSSLSHGANTWTGHVAVQRLHQHPRTSTEPWGRFFRLASCSTNSPRRSPIREHHRDDHHVRRDRKDRTFSERNQRQPPNRLRMCRQVDDPVVEPLNHDPFEPSIRTTCRMISAGHPD